MLVYISLILESVLIFSEAKGLNSFFIVSGDGYKEIDTIYKNKKYSCLHDDTVYNKHCTQPLMLDMLTYKVSILQNLRPRSHRSTQAPETLVHPVQNDPDITIPHDSQCVCYRHGDKEGVGANVK